MIKDNKIQVRAKHEEKTAERLSKSKFSKEYELTERIETYSLTGGLANDGRLIVGAFAKGHGEGSFSKPGGAPVIATAGNEAVNGMEDGVVDSQPPTAGTTSTNGGSGSALTASVLDEETGDRKSVAVEPCEVRPVAT